MADDPTPTGASQRLDNADAPAAPLALRGLTPVSIQAVPTRPRAVAQWCPGMKTNKDSRSGRAWALMSRTATAAGKFASAQLGGLVREGAERARSEFGGEGSSGQMLADSLDSLREATLKIGQLAEGPAKLLPGQLQQVLAKMRGPATRMDLELLRTQIRAELDEGLEDLFPWFETTPMATSSTGQIHRARDPEGRELVVKIQYPGTRAMLDSDWAQLDLAMRMAALALPNAGLEALSHDLKQRMLAKLDYRIEAQQLAALAQDCADYPGVCIPDVIEPWSSERVLTLTYEAGLGLDKLDRRDPSPDPATAAEAELALEVANFDDGRRQALAQRLLDFQIHCLFELGRVPADPQAGRFAVNRDGQLVVYDCSALLELSAEDRVQLKKLLRALRDRNPSALAEAVADLGLLRARGEGATASMYQVWVDHFAPALQPGARDPGTLDIDGQKPLLPDALRQLWTFQSTPQLSELKHHWAQVLAILKGLDAPVDVGQSLARHI